MARPSLLIWEFGGEKLRGYNSQVILEMDNRMRFTFTHLDKKEVLKEVAVTNARNQCHAACTD